MYHPRMYHQRDEDRPEMNQTMSSMENSVRPRSSAHTGPIRRQKARLDKRQKKWADTFSGKEQMAEFVVRELLSNATDAIIRQANNTGKRNLDGLPATDGVIHITVRGAEKYTVLLEVTDNGDGCKDFAKSIMTEGTSANQATESVFVTTGGKGSAKDCFSVQDGFSFVSKEIGQSRWRHFAGSQDIALEHTADCKFMDLKQNENRGLNTEKNLDNMHTCNCMENITVPPTSVYSNIHGTTVILALASVITGLKSTATNLTSRVRRIQKTVQKVIKYTAGRNSELDGIFFTLNGESIQPLLQLKKPELTIVNDIRFARTPFTRFNKDLKTYEAKFDDPEKDDGDPTNTHSMVVVLAETGMYQFLKQFETNHKNKITIVIQCSKSCKQLDAHRSRFQRESHQEVLEELVRRMKQVGNTSAIMDPSKARKNGEIFMNCDGDTSSTDPIGAFLAATFSLDRVNGFFGGIGVMKKEEREKLRKRLIDEKKKFESAQAHILVSLPVAFPGSIVATDARVVLAKNTSNHIEYLISKQHGLTTEAPQMYGTSQHTHLKLYRLYCIAVSIVHNVRQAAVELFGEALCSKDVRVQLEILDDSEEGPIRTTHKHAGGKCIIGVSLLRLVEEKAEMYHDYTSTDIMQKSMLSLLFMIVHEVAHCVTHHITNNEESPSNLNLHDAERELQSHLLAGGITFNRLCLPTYVKTIVGFAKKLKLAGIPRAERPRKRTKPNGSRFDQSQEDAAQGATLHGRPMEDSRSYTSGKMSDVSDSEEECSSGTEERTSKAEIKEGTSSRQEDPQSDNSNLFDSGDESESEKELRPNLPRADGNTCHQSGIRFTNSNQNQNPTVHHLNGDRGIQVGPSAATTSPRPEPEEDANAHDINLRGPSNELDSTVPDFSQSSSSVHVCSAISVLVFCRKDAKGALHSVSVFVGQDKSIRMDSSLREAMIAAKGLNKLVFRATTKEFIMEIQLVEREPVPITILSAREMKISNLLEIEGLQGKTVRIHVTDSPDSDEDENDVEF